MVDRSTSRRAFLKANTVAAAAAIALPIARGAHAAGSDTIRIGLIGCGGRGRGAAVNAMNTGKDVRLTAVADLFDFQARQAVNQLKKQKPDQIDLPEQRCFIGFDACKRLIDSGVDVVLIAATVHFHPTLLSAAVDAGKHVFAEKIHAIDIPGIQQTIAACEKAAKNRRSVVSGLCWRYNPAVQGIMKRIADGEIGRIVAIDASYMVGARRAYARKPDMTEMQCQIWNWYNFSWLSGDQHGAQLVHCLDLASWGMGDRPPLKAWGLGGRQVQTQPEFGDLFDHAVAVFEYESGTRLYASCRDQSNCHDDNSVIFLGTKGFASVPNRCFIQGDKSWKSKSVDGNMYDLEHVALFDAIRNDRPINNSNYMTTSSALAILSREVCYTGQQITWGDLMKSQATFALPKYDWDITPPVVPDASGRYPAAMPGITTFK